MQEAFQNFWNTSINLLINQLETSANGLTKEQSTKRQIQYKSKFLNQSKNKNILLLLLAQFTKPIILLILFAATLSGLLHQRTDAIIMFTIVIFSGFLQFWQESKAENIIAKLLEIVKVKITALRDGTEQEIPSAEVVPGDILILKAGAMIPADCRILESKDLFINEASLTGETYPAAKSVSAVEANSPLSKCINSVFMGTHVVSGYAKVLVVSIGKDTEFGKISEHLKLRVAETEFERGVTQFGNLLVIVTLILLIAVFIINVYFHHPVIESLLFSLALAVGMTPQLLPAIITINLSQGAVRMAEKQVIVKKLSSIQDFGSMNILCSDKTGTLTESEMELQGAYDFNDNKSSKALRFAYLNAQYESSFVNPIDEAIRNLKDIDISGFEKLDEIPYDFIRKRLSILSLNPHGDSSLMISKGALMNILSACKQAELSDGTKVDINTVQDKIEKQFQKLSNQGFRVLGIAYKNINKKLIAKEDEAEMIFLGILVFFAPIKPGTIEVIHKLKAMGVSLKMITGDNQLASSYVGEQVGLRTKKILTGLELNKISDEALLKLVNDVDIFAEVEPNQKERIINALKKSGNIVGYMGDGINDVPSLHTANVGISVNGAADVAKEAADIVLLKKDLSVLVEAVREGRVTFTNTLKYIFMAASANFGNMLSVAGASLFLPFLPLLPKQILLVNFLTDFPQMAIGSDNVDEEAISVPRRWDTKFIKDFMLTFGSLSSVFDFITFMALFLILNSSPEMFRTGWFLESVLSEALIFFAIRTQRLFYKSKPSKTLLIITFICTSTALIIPVTPIAPLLGFTAMPAYFLLVLIGIVSLYVFTNEWVKRIFYKRLRLH